VTDEFYATLGMNLRKEAWELLEHANLEKSTGCPTDDIVRSLDDDDNSTGVFEESLLSVADVLQVVDLYCSNPRLFSKVVVPVDPLNDSPDFIVNKLMLSFA